MRKLIRATVIVILALVVVIFVCNKIIIDNAKGKIFTDVNTIPENRVGLLLGTSKFLGNGNMNLYYQNRIIAATTLLKNKKIKYLIISGDNGRKEYNEPEMMRNDLIAAGVDSTAIFLDYAGFRTFDSMKRLKEVFDQDSVTIISQQFHNERALYIAKKEGITAIAYNAKDVNGVNGARVQLREKLAKVKVFVDYLFSKKPKFLGKKIVIPT